MNIDSSELSHWRTVIIRERDVGRRIDAYLAKRFPSYSRTKIVQYIREGRVVSESRKLKPSTLLQMGERLRLYVPGLVPTTPPPPLPEVLYEDARIIVANKPSGMLVHPAGDTFVWALIGLFKTARPDGQLDLVHRIDRETSGTIVLTKDKEANAFLKTKFANREVQKTYHAIVKGSPEWEVKDINAPIGIDEDSEVRLRRCVIEGGQYSHTTATVLQRMNGYSLVECALHTGRTHQIRVHMEHVGYPLLGDKLYGNPDWVFLDYLKHRETERMREHIRFPRHCLHAAIIRFPHPNGGFKKIRAPLPADMQSIVDGVPPNWIKTEQ